MADTDFGWVGPLMGTMVMGGILMKMTDKFLTGPQDQGVPVKKTKKKTDVYSRNTKLSQEELWRRAGWKPIIF
jgi:hypothetical protein